MCEEVFLIKMIKLYLLFNKNDYLQKINFFFDILISLCILGEVLYNEIKNFNSLIGKQRIYSFTIKQI